MSRFILLIIFFIAFNTNATESSKKVKKSKSAPIARVSNSVAKPWQPDVFVYEGEKLPPKYNGINSKRFYEMFQSNLKKLEKKEFETTQEFELRTSNKNELLLPISTSELYAFRMFQYFNLNQKYDADAKAYKIEQLIACSGPVTDGKNDNKWLVCPIELVKSENSTYAGSNAYGLTVEVDRTIGLKLSLAISENQISFKNMLSKNTDYSAYNYSYKDDLPIPVDKAVGLKNKTIAVIFVGQILEAKTVKGYGEHSRATIEWTYEKSIDEEAIPFDLKKVVYYVYETGEILGTKEF